MAHAHIELTGLWGPDRATITQWRNAGYHIAQERNMRTGDVIGQITAPEPGSPSRTPSSKTGQGPQVSASTQTGGSTRTQHGAPPGG